MSRLIEADAAIDALTEYGNGRAVYIGVEEAVRRIEQLPSAEQDTTTHDSIPAETGKNDGDGISGDCIGRTQTIDALRDYLVEKRCPDDGTLTCRLIENEVINKLPSIQPECKDALEKAVAVEAISDELMLRFDISATYAYEVAEKAINRIEAMAKEMGKGEQDG